jgi:RNA polymerase sigma-70 factor (ECF subfamily)
MSHDAVIREIAVLRPQLLRAAQRRLHNKAWAEDAVSETILAALERPQAFEGRSQLSTWLMGVLKHKLVDQVRRHAKESGGFFQPEVDDGGETGEARMAPGHACIDWRDPMACVHEKQLLIHVDACLKTLPDQQARAFVLRDCMECETDEVCEELGITAGHLSVVLYRARRRLREVVLAS